MAAVIRVLRRRQVSHTADAAKRVCTVRRLRAAAAAARTRLQRLVLLLLMVCVLLLRLVVLRRLILLRLRLIHLRVLLAGVRLRMILQWRRIRLLWRLLMRLLIWLLRLHLRRQRVVQHRLQRGEKLHIGDGRHQRRTAERIVLLLLVQLLRTEVRLVLRVLVLRRVRLRLLHRMGLLWALMEMGLVVLLLLLLVIGLLMLMIRLMFHTDIRMRGRETLAVRRMVGDRLMLVMGRVLLILMRVRMVMLVVLLLSDGRRGRARRIERRRVRVVRIGRVLRRGRGGRRRIRRRVDTAARVRVSRANDARTIARAIAIARTARIASGTAALLTAANIGLNGSQSPTGHISEIAAAATALIVDRCIDGGAAEIRTARSQMRRVGSTAAPSAAAAATAAGRHLRREGACADRWVALHHHDVLRVSDQVRVGRRRRNRGRGRRGRGRGGRRIDLLEDGRRRLLLVMLRLVLVQVLLVVGHGPRQRR